MLQGYLWSIDGLPMFAVFRLRLFARAWLAAWLFYLLTPLALAAEDEAEGEVVEAPRLEYYNLKPTFVTNFGPPDTPRLMYLKADVALRVLGSAGLSAADTHAPALRNQLVLLLSGLDENSVTTSEGREDMKLEALEALNEILVQEEGEALIDDLLFTNFVVQR